MTTNTQTKLKELARKCSEQLCCDCGENLNAVNATVIRAYEMGIAEANAELRRIAGVNHGLSEAVEIYEARCKKLEEKLRVAKEALRELTFNSCTCLTRTPKTEYHMSSCHYRIAKEALAVIEKENNEA